MQQVQAVWDALAARGLSYVNVATDSGTSCLVSTQYVRFLDQSVQRPRRELRRRLGPFCLDPAPDRPSAGPAVQAGPLLHWILRRCRGGPARRVRDHNAGHRLLSPRRPAEGAKELQATLPYPRDPQYSIVDIALCRQQGINPIPFQPPVTG
jgi:hypothetical protein